MQEWEKFKELINNINNLYVNIFEILLILQVLRIFILKIYLKKHL